MKIEFFNYKDDNIWFWFGLGLYLLLTLCFVLNGSFIDGSLFYPIMWFCLGGYGFYYFALMPNKISLSETEIQYKNIIGQVKKISVKEITFTEEYELQSDVKIFPPPKKREQKLVLYLHFPKYRVKIYKDSFDIPYDEVLAYCKTHLQRVAEPKKKYQYFVPLYVLIGVLLFHFGLEFYCEHQKLQGTITIKGTYLAHDLTKESGKGAKGYQLNIYLKEYPNLEFGTWYRIEREHKNAVDSILKAQPQTFIFTISRDDYEKKLRKSVPMEFCDKYLNRNFVEVREKLHEIKNDKGQQVFRLD